MIGFQKAGTAPGVRVEGDRVFCEGFAYGLREPSLQVVISWHGPSFGISRVMAESSRWQALDARLEGLPGHVQHMPDDVAKVGHWMLHWCVQLQRVAGLPVFGSGRVVDGPNMDPACVRLVIPTFPAAVPQVANALGWLFNVTNAAASGSQLKNLFGQLPQALASLESAAPRRSNTPRLMMAAYQRGLPVTVISDELVQYGQGHHSVWMQSSFTEQTPVIAAQLARDKSRAAALLRQAGLPVATHYQVRNESEAVEAARQLGYPVVVKPGDRDGGTAVASGLKTPEAVRAAFRRAAEASRKVIVEEHVAGRDYRLTVFQGEVVLAIERKPAGVTGDGARTVEELVARENADPNRGSGPSPLKLLTIDDDARSLLAESDLTPGSVPRSGQFVQLRRAANIGLGGFPVRIEPADMHADNLELAIRAARVLRLDFAGVDLIIPDIRHSWKSSGGVVCEVNAQPQLGRITAPELPGQILDRIVPGRGRIFSVVVVGDATPGHVAASIQVALTREGVCLVPKDLSDGPFACGRQAVLDPEAEATVLDVCDESLLVTGLPVDRIDVLVVCGRRLRGCPEDDEAFGRLLDFLLPACQGKVIDSGGPAVLQLSTISGAGTGGSEVIPVSPERVAAVVVESCHEALSTHGHG